LFWAGAVLAIATIKPQLVLPLAAYLVLWAVSDLRRRRGFLLGFFGVLTLLLAGSELLLPGWFGDFLVAAENYRHYTGRLSLLDVLLSSRFGGFASTVVLVSMLRAYWHFRNERPGTSGFSVIMALALANTVIVIPMFALYNTFLLLPAVLVILQNWRLLWNAGGPSRVSLILSATAVGWPWVAALGLDLASLLLSPAAIQQGWSLPLTSSFKFPIPVVCLLPLTFMVIWAWRRREAMVPASESSAA